MKFINFILLLAISLGTIGINTTIKNSEKYPPSVVNYDGNDYAGYSLNSGNVKTFSHEIDLTNSDLETPFIQFVITPSQRGDGSTYSPDFENLVFTLTDTAGKTMTISFYPRKADSPRYYYLNVSAMGETQTLLGEHQANYQWALDPNDGAYLSDVYGGISPYTFDGYGADYSWFKFYDKNGNTFTSGCQGVVSLYYDSKENALYADTGFQWVDDDPSKPLTLTDKFTLSKSGERRWRIRDFDKDDYLKGSSVISTVWNGFEDLKHITFKASFQKVITEDPSILIVTLGGTSIVENFYVKSFTKAVKDVSFPIPKPLFFSDGHPFDFATSGGKVKIEDSEGNVVLSETNYVNDMTFTPLKADNFTITYSLIDPIYSTPTVYKYSLEALSSGGTILLPNAPERGYVVNELIDAGVVVSNDVQEYLPSVSLSIKKNGVEVYNTDELDVLSYRFEEEGEYVFNYSSTDLLGRKTDITRTYSVSKYCLKMKEGLSESVVVSDLNNISRPLNSDFYILDVVTGEIITPTSVSILISKNGGEFKPYDKDNYINDEGTYIIKYVYSHESGSVTAQRKYTVFKELPSIKVNDVPKNSLLAKDSSLDDDSIRVVVLKGSVALIPNDLFKSDYPLTIEKYEKNGTLVDVTQDYKSSGLTITFSNLNEYIVSAKIVTDSGYTVRKNIIFEVKEGLISFTPVEKQVANVGHTVELVMPEAKDFYGNKIEDGIFTILFNGSEIEVSAGKFTPKDLGEYKVTYTAQAFGYAESYTYSYKIVDTEAPKISFDDVKTQISVGKFVKIEGYKVSDNSGKAVDIKVSVTYNDEVISIYNGGFDCTNAGEYIVKITATDMAGNTSTETLVMSTNKSGCKSQITSYSIAIILLLLGINTIALCNLKRKENKMEV